jgi:hypothetical protein
MQPRNSHELLACAGKRGVPHLTEERAINLMNYLRPRARMGVAVLSCAALAAGGVALAAGSARATTATCTNIATPVSAPIGCGGLYLPGMGTGTQPDGTSLTLTADGNQFDAAVRVQAYDPSNSLQDFTVFQVCDTVIGTRTPADPCGSGTTAKNPVNGQGEYIAMLTPDGTSTDWPPSSPSLGDASNDFCLSVTEVTRTVNKKPAKRWVTVLRNCAVDAGFIPGKPDTPADAGTPGVVTGNVNPWQVWSPIASGASGYVLAEDYLSDNFKNTPYVLDDSGYGGAGTQQLAYPLKDPSQNVSNQVWKVVGCTNPVVDLTPGFYSCP